MVIIADKNIARYVFNPMLVYKNRQSDEEQKRW
jgi:hypothetical protein